MSVCCQFLGSRRNLFERPSHKWTQGDGMKRIIVCEQFVCLTSIADK